MMEVQGLIVSVFKNPLYKGCSLNGLSEQFDDLILIGEGVEGPAVVDLDNPPENVVTLVKRKLFGGKEPYLHVEPLDGCNNGGDKWYMAGGALCYTSDSRFPCVYPLQIHDRCEK